tara:strand:- start:145 stop:855 length:711 start_codon:yes stop_codon:yes gene_type:complete
MQSFDYVNLFSQEFRRMLTELEQKVEAVESSLSALDSKISSVKGSGTNYFWARLQCAKQMESEENGSAYWMYGWEQFDPNIAVNNIPYSVRVSGAADPGGDYDEEEVLTSRTSHSEGIGNPDPVGGENRFSSPAYNLLELYQRPGIASKDTYVASHGETIGQYAGANIALRSCGNLAEAEACAILKEDDPETNCLCEYSNPVVLMYQGYFNTDREYDLILPEYFFVLPNSVSVACQ